MQERDDRVTKLNSLYDDSDTIDRELFSEQRSNWLLYIGYHFNRYTNSLTRFMRGQDKGITEKKGLRIVKNHLGSICDKLAGHVVLNHNPDVVIEPKNKTEVQDRKAAEIGDGVWKHIKKVNGFDETKEDYANDFIVGGEVACWVGFDPSKGDLVGIDAEIDEETGQIISQTPRFSGEVCIKRIETFNLLRDPAAKTWRDARFVIWREMVDKKDLKTQFPDNKELIDSLGNDGAEEDFVVFDAQKGEYTKAGREKTLVKKIFYRPCSEYPEGYYIFFNSDAIIAEGSLNNVFPIVYKPYQKVSTSPRGYSVIKRLRSNQIEINRIASYISESQVNFREKLLISSGTKISHGGMANGVAGIKYSGAAPIVMNGQSGEKYLSTLDHAIGELYKLSHVREESEEKQPNSDAYSLLTANLKEKKRFSVKSDIFEAFLTEVAETALDVARLYYTEENIINMVDKREQINIAEFRNMGKLSYSLNVMPMSQDINSMLGQQVSIAHILQYAQNLPEDYTAHLVASMPFLKDTHLAEEITANVRSVDDVFAAIERGEQPPISEHDDHAFFARKISIKMKTSAFNFLHPQIQQMYQFRLQQHSQIMAQQKREELMKDFQMVPMGGGLITVSGLKNQAGEVIRLPHDALMWLIEKLSTQGAVANEMGDQVPTAVISQMAKQMQLPQQTQTQTQGMPQNPQPMGEGMIL